MTKETGISKNARGERQLGLVTAFTRMENNSSIIARCGGGSRPNQTMSSELAFAELSSANVEMRSCGVCCNGIISSQTSYLPVPTTSSSTLGILSQIARMSPWRTRKRTTGTVVVVQDRQKHRKADSNSDTRESSENKIANGIAEH